MAATGMIFSILNLKPARCGGQVWNGQDPVWLDQPFGMAMVMVWPRLT